MGNDLNSSLQKLGELQNINESILDIEVSVLQSLIHNKNVILLLM